MQVTFFILYLFFYVITLWTFLLSLVICLPLFFFSHVSFATSFSFLKNYTKWNLLILTLFFLLSGLPPVGLFFIKFNIVVYTLQYWNIFFTIIIFFIFFFNMIFYLQIFKFKKIWIYPAVLFQGPLYKSNACTSNLAVSPQPTQFKLLLRKDTLQFYNIMYIIILLTLLNLFSIFFITDLYLIFMNLLYV